MSVEERERRRQRALELVKQGKIGGPRPGSGRPRKRRASEVLNERIEKNAEEIWKVFEDSIARTAPPHVRLQAATKLLEIEREELRLEAEEHRRLHEQTKDKLIEDLVGTLARLSHAGVTMPEHVDTTFEELGDGDSSA